MPLTFARPPSARGLAPTVAPGLLVRIQYSLGLQSLLPRRGTLLGQLFLPSLLFCLPRLDVILLVAVHDHLLAAFPHDPALLALLVRQLQDFFFGFLLDAPLWKENGWRRRRGRRHGCRHA